MGTSWSITSQSIRVLPAETQLADRLVMGNLQEVQAALACVIMFSLCRLPCLCISQKPHLVAFQVWSSTRAVAQFWDCVLQDPVNASPAVLVKRYSISQQKHLEQQLLLHEEALQRSVVCFGISLHLFSLTCVTCHCTSLVLPHMAHLTCSLMLFVKAMLLGLFRGPSASSLLQSSGSIYHISILAAAPVQGLLATAPEQGVPCCPVHTGSHTRINVHQHLHDALLLCPVLN